MAAIPPGIRCQSKTVFPPALPGIAAAALAPLRTVRHRKCLQRRLGPSRNLRVLPWKTEKTVLPALSQLIRPCREKPAPIGSCRRCSEQPPAPKPNSTQADPNAEQTIFPAGPACRRPHRLPQGPELRITELRKPPPNSRPGRGDARECQGEANNRRVFEQSGPTATSPADGPSTPSEDAAPQVFSCFRRIAGHNRPALRLLAALQGHSPLYETACPTIRRKRPTTPSCRTATAIGINTKPATRPAALGGESPMVRRSKPVHRRGDPRHVSEDRSR